MQKIHLAGVALLLCHLQNLRAADKSGCQVQAMNADDQAVLGGGDKLRGPAVIFGDFISVPAFRLRFVDSITGQLLRPAAVAIAYGWRWLEYPYSEHPWGAVSVASDVTECTEIKSDEIEVPAFEVKPRGWYDGKYAKLPFSRRPSFDGIDIVAGLPLCRPRVTITPSAARNLEGKTVVVNVVADCHSKSTVSLKPRKIGRRVYAPVGRS